MTGSKYSESLFPSYSLPNGKLVHYCYEPRKIIDEVDVFWPPCEAPTGLRDIFQSCLPDVSFMVGIVTHRVRARARGPAPPPRTAERTWTRARASRSDCEAAPRNPYARLGDPGFPGNNPGFFSI